MGRDKEGQENIACHCQKEKLGTRLLRSSSSFAVLLAWMVGLSLAASENALVPFSRLTSDDRQALAEIVRTPTLSREVRGLKFWSRKEVYEYLLNHPDFAAAVARAFGLSEYQVVKDAKVLRASGDSYWGTDGTGATGHFRVVYADEKKRVFFLDGTLNKKWLPTISARSVMVLIFEHKASGEGSYVENDLYAYIKIDNTFVAYLVKLLRPIIGSMAHEKIEHILSVGATVSEMAYRDPAGFLKKLEESPELPRKEFDEFRRTLYVNVQ